VGKTNEFSHWSILKILLIRSKKSVVKGCIGTDEQSVVEGNIYTAQTENTLSSLLPNLLKVLK
jgi:uncharacterized membrane protein YciS (DUF1049 family)